MSVLNKYLEPIEFVFSISCNTVSLCVLSTRSLRVSSCTHYILAYTVLSIIYMVQICPINILASFGIVWSANRYGSKIQKYTVYLPTITSGLMLSFASFDRYCSTSTSIRLRSICTVQRARLFIVITMILMSIYLIPLMIVSNYNESTNTCIRSSSDILAGLFLGTLIILIYIIIPISLIVFGYLTVYNIHQSLMRVRGERRMIKISRTERQLTRMLIAQTGLYIVAKLPYGVIFCMNSFFPSTLTPTVAVVREICVLWLQTNFSVSFFIFIVAAKVYREELIKLFRLIKCLHTQTYPI